MISFSLFHIVIGVIAGFFIVSVTLRFFRNEHTVTFFKLAVTYGIWGTISVFAFFPWTGRALSIALGFGDNLNTLIFIGFVVIFMILFKIVRILERIERTISDIVREEALRTLTEQKKK